MGIFNGFKRAIGSGIASFAAWLGAYNSTNPRRKILSELKVQRATADQALAYNRQTLVNQCRHLERNTATGRALVEGLKADIVGTGIDVEPDTGDDALNEQIRDLWRLWAESASIDGTPLWELQNQAMGEIATAGCMLWRFIVLPERAEEGLPPVAVIPLEAEWFSAIPVDAVADDTFFIDGIERDAFGRVVAYHLRNPDLLQFNGIDVAGERIPAEKIEHGFEKRRPMQTHGEPIMAPAIERIKQEEDLVAIELQGAKNSAAMAIKITSEYQADLTDDGTNVTGDAVNDIPLGSTVRLFPGEDAAAIKMERPNPLVKDFRGMLRGDVAGACRIPRKWLDRDYSSATYMNTRMEQLDAKRQHRHTQHWLGRHIASRPYLEVLPWILQKLGREMPADPAARRQIMKHKLVPDLPEYVDPLKDGQAAIQNINGGLSTLEEECGSRGKDWRKVIDQIAVERKYAEEKGITLAPPDNTQPAAPVGQEKKDSPDSEKKDGVDDKTKE